MPVIRVTWWEGQPRENKVKVAKAITEVMSSVGIPAAATHVVFENVSKDDWASEGKLASEPR
jgi:phenylpyruvate tautomerase PptA (4-oxalocrotonate tautomerase family)